MTVIACWASAAGWRGKVGTTAVPSSMPGTWLPATASAVSASRPKMWESQAEAKPSSAAWARVSRSPPSGSGPVASFEQQSDTHGNQNSIRLVRRV